MTSIIRLRGSKQANGTLPVSSPAGEQHSPDDNWEELDLSSSEYMRRRRELMQLVNDLRSLGAETLFDLPYIVVIGGQSAGKSSLVEAVSGVNVPRDSGTCTRCPMECTMSSNATAWSCKIKLRFDYDSSGLSAANPRVIPFGPTITDRSEVDVWLRRAQAAILNPDLSPESFHKRTPQDLKNLSSLNTLKFSRNVVSIFIEDPTSTDLSFVDLPDDMENQLSVRLAKEADPQGERTIGILTKPDLLGDGAVNAKKLWLDVIEGHAHKLKHGYYCVRLPDDAQRAQRLSRSAFQRDAADWFDTTSPWSELTNRGRFGVPAFVTDISVLLVSHINKVVPRLRQDVEQLLATCEAEIDTLPKPLEADPQTEVLARVNAFCDNFKGVVSGANPDKSLAQRNRALYTIFTHEIQGTAPDFRPFEEPEEYMRIDVLDSEDSFEAQDNRVQTMGVHEVRKTILEATGWELPGNIPYGAKTRLISQFTTLWSAPAEKCLTSINGVLDDVIQRLVEKHFGPFRVLHDFIFDLIHPDIEEHKTNALNAIKETLELETAPRYTQNLRDYGHLREKWLAKYRNARRNPGKYRTPQLDAECWKEVCHGELDPAESCDSPSRARTAKLKPSSTSKSSNVFTGSISESVEIQAPPEQKALHYLAQAGYKGLTIDDLTRLSPRDHFEDELIVMADVRAYFTIAYKRVIDHVSLKIEQSLHRALAESLSTNLLHRLLADTASTDNFTDRMRELVSEDPVIEAQRIRLEAKCGRLEEMKNRLLNIAA